MHKPLKVQDWIYHGIRCPFQKNELFDWIKLDQINLSLIGLRRKRLRCGRLHSSGRQQQLQLLSSELNTERSFTSSFLKLGFSGTQQHEHISRSNRRLRYIYAVSSPVMVRLIIKVSAGCRTVGSASNSAIRVFEMFTEFSSNAIKKNGVNSFGVTTVYFLLIQSK